MKEAQVIKTFLSRYYKAHGTDVTFMIIKSIVIKRHEVAWMEYKGTVLCGEKRGESFVGRALYCECHFKEGVGWKRDKKYGVVSLGDKEKCRERMRVICLRHEELKREYKRRFGCCPSLKDHVSEIILDLIEKVKAEEFVEGSDGASFYGGYFYLQTVANIIGLSMGNIWAIAKRMADDKQISLEGAVVIPYRKPPRAKWNEVFRIKGQGWTGVAYAPDNSQMKKFWKFKILAPDGKVFRHNIPNLPIIHSLAFGVDVEDLDSARRAIRKFFRRLTILEW
ncbi:MAG: hypothetical protein HZA94_03335 [Candidatus Vogelbacteria bacterium]|nr:hypothetical protein [Candidatus Vogelbacteria bacterium]